MRTWIAIGLLATSGLAMAQAQPDNSATRSRMESMLESHFQQADVNHDGKLTQQEAANGGMPRIAQHFAQIDTDGKGYITLDQIKAAMAKMQGQ